MAIAVPAATAAVAIIMVAAPGATAAAATNSDSSAIAGGSRQTATRKQVQGAEATRSSKQTASKQGTTE